mmetsp:Transcript_15311/g.36456  ORF Transcript_15311/g.36456 Transcript_15311/m.36456 type:complete len:317 (+) Transcript_15311:668-1618(+)
MRSSEMASRAAQVSSSSRSSGDQRRAMPCTASTPRTRMGAVNGSIRQGLAGSVLVPWPAGSPWSKAHCATPRSGCVPAPGSTDNTSRPGAAASAGASTAAPTPNSARRKRAPISATCSGTKAAPRSRDIAYSPRTRRSRSWAARAWAWRPAASWPTTRPTINITANVTRYCASLTAKDQRGSTNTKSKASTAKNAAKAAGARPKRQATPTTLSWNSIAILVFEMRPTSGRHSTAVTSTDPRAVRQPHSVRRVSRPACSGGRSAASGWRSGAGRATCSTSSSSASGLKASARLRRPGQRQARSRRPTTSRARLYWRA